MIRKLTEFSWGGLVVKGCLGAPWNNVDVGDNGIHVPEAEPEAESSKSPERKVPIVLTVLFIPLLIPAGIHGIPGIPAGIPGIRRNDPQFRNSGGIRGGIRLQFGYQSHNLKCTYVL
jgi:hypothetical protein